MRVAAGGMLALVLLSITALFTAFKAGETWALWAVPISGIVFPFIALVGMRIVARNTPAKPPMWSVPVGVGLLLAGLVISLLH